MTLFAWGFAAGYIVAKLINMIGAIRSAKRDANRRIAEARRDVIERGGHPSEKELNKTGLPKLPPGPGPGSDVEAGCTCACERRGHEH